MAWLIASITHNAADIKVVGVFRTEESAKKVSTRLGSPPEDKFVSVIGNFGTCSPRNISKFMRVCGHNLFSYVY